MREFTAGGFSVALLIFMAYNEIVRLAVCRTISAQI
jgi:hypothetical protein